MYEISDIVQYKKDGNIYTIKKIAIPFYTLYGINNRSIVVCEEKDIDKISNDEIKHIYNKDENKKKRVVNLFKTRKNNTALFGRVLHIDGDEEFLNKCLNLYQDLGIYAYGVALNEKDIYQHIEKIILEITPDIIVFTGHDQFYGDDIKSLDNYENSKYFIKAIRKVRKHFLDVVIIAGACSSHFEALIGSGANFASSPKRVNTHTYDPAICAIKVATTPYDQRVDFKNIYKYIENGKEALGGIETKGKMKLLM